MRSNCHAVSAASEWHVRADIYRALLPQIIRLDRYERRVLARRRRAATALDALTVQGCPLGIRQNKANV